MFYTILGSSVLEASTVESQQIPSIDTLDQYSISNSVDTWLPGQQSVDSKLMSDWCLWAGWHSADYPLTVHQVSIEYWSSINWDVEEGYQSSAFINNQLWMALVRIIHFFLNFKFKVLNWQTWKWWCFEMVSWHLCCMWINCKNKQK